MTTEQVWNKICWRGEDLQNLNLCIKLVKFTEFEYEKFYEKQNSAIAIRKLNNMDYVTNSFYATCLFRSPLPLQPRLPQFFWCFQGVSKETSSMKWVNKVKLQVFNSSKKNLMRAVDESSMKFWWIQMTSGECIWT